MFKPSNFKIIVKKNKLYLEASVTYIVCKSNVKFTDCLENIGLLVLGNVRENEYVSMFNLLTNRSRYISKENS